MTSRWMSDVLSTELPYLELHSCSLTADQTSSLYPSLTSNCLSKCGKNSISKIDTFLSPHILKVLQQDQRNWNLKQIQSYATLGPYPNNIIFNHGYEKKKKDNQEEFFSLNYTLKKKTTFHHIFILYFYPILLQ